MKNLTPKSMRRLTVLAVLFTLSVMLMPAAFTQGRQDFTLVNRSGIAVSELYISPNKSDDWGKDILGRDTLPTGQRTDIVFDSKTKDARWDIQIVDENGKKHTKSDLNLFEISEITVKDNGKGDGGWNWATKEQQ